MKLTLLFLVFVLSGTLRAQDTTELVRRNGFKTIHLGAHVDSIKGSVLKKDIKEKDEFAAQLYEVESNEFKMIGEVHVKDIKLKTYQGLIYEIDVFTEKDERVITALEKSFGKAVWINRQMCWKWSASTLTLTFYSHKNDLELIYRSAAVIKKMYTDKGKKLDAIAEGF